MIRNILIIFYCVYFYSCKRTTSVEFTPRMIPDFPCSINNSWTYSTFDSLTNSLRTLTVKIIQNISQSDTLVLQLWKFEDETKADTIIVSIKKDTVLFSDQMFQPLSIKRGISKLVFPLKTGNGWRITGVPRYDLFLSLITNLLLYLEVYFPILIKLKSILGD